MSHLSSVILVEQAIPFRFALQSRKVSTQYFYLLEFSQFGLIFYGTRLLWLSSVAVLQFLRHKGRKRY